MTTQPTTKCDPIVYERGRTVCILAGTSTAIEAIVVRVREELGVVLDWHYVGGRANILTLATPEKDKEIRNAIQSAIPAWLWPSSADEEPPPRSKIDEALHALKNMPFDQAWWLESGPECTRCHAGLIWEGDPPETAEDAICHDCAWKELEALRAQRRESTPRQVVERAAEIVRRLGDVDNLRTEQVECVDGTCVVVVSYLREVVERPPITHVAIRFQDKIWSLPRPYRHHHIIRLIIWLSDFGDQSISHVDAYGDDQGFLDAKGRYLTRAQAQVSAELNNQIKNGKVIGGPLTSEDLW